MRTKTTIALLVANLALFAYIFYFEGGFFGDGSETERSRQIFHAETIDIDYLRIEGRNMEAAHELQRERDRWRLLSPVAWPANEHAVSRILNQLQFLEAETEFSLSDLQRAGQDLSDFGLDDPWIALTFGREGRRHELKIGAATESGNRIYLLDPARGRIHAVRRELAHALTTPLEDLRSDAVFQIPLFEVRSLTLETTAPRNVKMRVVRSDDLWTFETPIQVRADRQAVEATVNNLAAIKVRRFENDISDDLESYGLDQPFMRITLDGNMRSQSLLVGAETTGTDGERQYYAKMPRGSTGATVFTVAADRIDPLGAAQDTLRDRDFLRFDLDQLSAISIGVPTRNPVALQKLETGSWQLVTRDLDESIRLLRADSTIVNRLINRLANLRARSFVSDAPSAADLEEFGFTEPQRRVVLSGDRERTLLLGYFSPTRANEIYAKLEGSDFVYTVDNSILEVLPVISRFYRDRLLMSRPEGARITSMTLFSLDRDAELFSIELPSRETTWDEVLDEQNEEIRQAVQALLPELRQLRVESYILNEFPPLLEMGRETRHWVYVLETTYALTGGEEDQISYFELYLTDRMGGENLLAGSPELNVVFSARREFVEAISQLIDFTENARSRAEEAATDVTDPPESSDVPSS